MRISSHRFTNPSPVNIFRVKDSFQIPESPCLWQRARLVSHQLERAGPAHFRLFHAAIDKNFLLDATPLREFPPRIPCAAKEAGKKVCGVFLWPD